MRQGQLQDIPTYRFIIAATMVFIVGLFVFTIIFRAYITFQELQATIIQSGAVEGDDATLILLAGVPWALGGVYVSLLGAVIFFLLKGNKKTKERPPPSSFRGRYL